MRRALSDADPAGWCLQAETLAGLADRLSYALSRRGPSGALCRYQRGEDVHVQAGTRWVRFRRAPAVPDVWGEWGWYGECSDEDALKLRMRSAEDALRWVLGWPARG